MFVYKSVASAMVGGKDACVYAFSAIPVMGGKDACVCMWGRS